MKIALIGSTQYVDKLKEIFNRLRLEGHNVRLPFLDSASGSVLYIAGKNREMIEWCDEVHVIWDNRSSGTIFDFGMAFALRKKLVIEYIEPKTFQKLFEQYEKATE